MPDGVRKMLLFDPSSEPTAAPRPRLWAVKLVVSAVLFAEALTLLVLLWPRR